MLNFMISVRLIVINRKKKVWLIAFTFFVYLLTALTYII